MGNPLSKASSRVSSSKRNTRKEKTRNKSNHPANLEFTSGQLEIVSYQKEIAPMSSLNLIESAALGPAPDSYSIPAPEISDAGGPDEEPSPEEANVPVEGGAWNFVRRWFCAGDRCKDDEPSSLQEQVNQDAEQYSFPLELDLTKSFIDPQTGRRFLYCRKGGHCHSNDIEAPVTHPNEQNGNYMACGERLLEAEQLLAKEDKK